MEYKRLTKDQILLIHQKDSTLQHTSAGLRDESMLDLCASSPFQSMFGQDLYPDLTDKAAHLGFSLCHTHCFIDGNKRIAYLAMKIFLKLNNVEFSPGQREVIGMIFQLAEGKIESDQFTNWVRKNCSYVDTKKELNKEG